MSINQDVNETIQIVKIINRTWRVECFTEYQSDYTLRAHREKLYLDAAGNVVKREALPCVQRKVSQVQVDLGAMTMLKSVKDEIDAWATEDGEA